MDLNVKTPAQGPYLLEQIEPASENFPILEFINFRNLNYYCLKLDQIWWILSVSNRFLN